MPTSSPFGSVTLTCSPAANEVSSAPARDVSRSRPPLAMKFVAAGERAADFTAAADYRSFVALTRASDAVFVEPVDQRAARNTEELGGARLIAGAFVERFEDALLFELGDRRANLRRHVARDH